MELATIGFTRTSAQHFFERLTGAGVERVVDVRLRNTSQLDGFAKRDDLEFFLAGAEIAYAHDLRLAPNDDLLKQYRSTKDWAAYERGFLALMIERSLPGALNPQSYKLKTALLCSEASADHCHRRLVAEMLSRAWGASLEHL